MKQSSYAVVDLHSDLLSYFNHQSGRTPDEPISRCSYPQMLAGHVKLQTLAIFSATSAFSVRRAEEQISQLQSLFRQYPDIFAPLSQISDLHSSPAPTVNLIAAFENASGFALEDEPIKASLERLARLHKILGNIFYIGMTWDGENRFGGGVGSSAGLKEDGKRLLEWLSGQRIAVDFSHTSDKLAYEIIEYIDKHGLQIPLMASHSNFRTVTDMPRNLPDEIAKELIRRKGLIGLNFIVPFISWTDPTVWLRHVEYGLSLGGADALSFGADFFCDADFPHIKEKYNGAPLFYPEYGNASCYPYVLEQLANHLKLDEDQLKKIASENALKFLEGNI